MISWTGFGWWIIGILIGYLLGLFSPLRGGSK